MKEIKIKIYGWPDLKKWFWDRFCFPRRKLVAEWLDYYSDEARSIFEKLLLKYNKEEVQPEETDESESETVYAVHEDEEAADSENV